eukprot:8128708-Pyramimonas_sp.AAC.1
MSIEVDQTEYIKNLQGRSDGDDPPEKHEAVSVPSASCRVVYHDESGYMYILGGCTETRQSTQGRSDQEDECVAEVHEGEYHGPVDASAEVAREASYGW